MCTLIILHQIQLYIYFYFSSENEVLDERIQPICRQLLVNNLQSGNVGSLLQVFLSRSKELLASTQTEKYVSLFSSVLYFSTTHIII